MGDGMATKIYAHRGASRDYPEHTLQAYLGAIEQGADGFECDVRLTKDGSAVLWHDADMKRATKYLGLIAELNFREVQSKYPSVMLLSDFIELAIENKKDLVALFISASCHRTAIPSLVNLTSHSKPSAPCSMAPR